MRRRLTKSSTNVMISGTLAGIGEYLGIDPTILRVAYAMITFIFVGTPIVLYFILMMIIPSGTPRPYRQPRSNRRNGNPYYDQSGPYQEQPRTKMKKAEKLDDDDDWSDF